MKNRNQIVKIKFPKNVYAISVIVFSEKKVEPQTGLDLLCNSTLKNVSQRRILQLECVSESASHGIFLAAERTCGLNKLSNSRR